MSKRVLVAALVLWCAAAHADRGGGVKRFVLRRHEHMFQKIFTGLISGKGCSGKVVPALAADDVRRTLGLETADCLVELSGFPLATRDPEAVLMRLEETVRLYLVVERNGMRRTLEYAWDPPELWVPPASPSPPTKDAAALAKGIRCKGQRCEMDRSLFDATLRDTSGLAMSARIIPVPKDGRVVGFKLYALRPGSLFSLLGFHNGDLITTLNGQSIATPDEALMLYAKIRTANELKVDLERSGEPLTIVVAIVDDKH